MPTDTASLAEPFRTAPRVTGALLLALLALTLFLYASGWSGAFLFDDVPAFTANPLMKIDGRDFDQWRVAAVSGTAGPLGRPLSMLSFAAQHALDGDFSVAAVKRVNTLLHLASGVLLFCFLRRLFTAPHSLGLGAGEVSALALLTSAMWLLHPLHVSTVLYSVQRMAQLSTLFTLAGLLVFVHYRSRWARRGAGPAEIAAAAAWLLFFTLLAAFSKENGILLPWLVVACEVAVFRGLWGSEESALLRRLAAVALAMPLLLVIAILLLHPELLLAGYGGRDFGLGERLLSQARILWNYLGLLLWPQPHAMGFQHDDVLVSQGLLQPASTALAVLGWLFAAVLAVVLRRRQPLLLFALLFFIVAHSLESSVIPLELFYEHRNYLPSLAVLLLPAWALVLLARRVSRPLAVAVAVLPVLLLAVALAARVHSWGDDLRLAQVNAARHPASARSQYFLANSLLRQYRNREQLGLSEEQAGTAVALARHHLELMHRSAPRDLSALVMLHYVDGRFFRDTPIAGDWLPVLRAVLDGGPLSASSLNALVLLAECLGDGSCTGGASALAALQQPLRDVYGNRELAALLETRFLLAAQAPATVVQAALEAYLALPGADPLLLVESARNHLDLGDRDAFFDDMLRWFAADRRHRYLQTQRALLNAAR